MDTLVSLRVFALVAEQRSFIAAAGRMGLSAAMVSKHVANLEKRIGIRLLNRTSRRVSLTESGSLYLAQVRQMLDNLDEVEASIGNTVVVPRGTLRLSAPVWAASEHFVDCLAEYHRRYPDVRLEIELSGRTVDIVDDGYDLALRATSAERLDRGLIARPIVSVSFKLVGSPAYLDKAGRPTRLSDLSKMGMLVYSPAVTGETLTVSIGDGQATFRALPVVQSENETLLHLSALAGMGLAALPSWMVQKDIDAGRLEEVLSTEPQLNHMLYAVYPSRKYLSAKVRTFIDHCVEFLADARLKTA